MGFMRSAMSGFSWSLLHKGASTGISLIKIALLARLLSPSDFGTFSLIAVTLGISEALTETGINYTLLQSEKPISYYLNSAWLISLARGVLIAGVMLLLGLVIQTLNPSVDMQSALYLAALVPLIRGAINPAIIQFHKNLKFKTDTLYRLSLPSIELITAVTVALFFPSALALVVALVVSALWEVSISFLACKTWPKLRYDPEPAWEILSRAKLLSIGSLLTYVHENVDDLILGTRAGTYQLGLYHGGYSISHRATYDIARAAHYGTLPILSQFNTDQPRLRSAYLRSAAGTLGLCLLASIPIFLFPTFIVQVALGEKWLAVIPLLPWLLVAGITQSLTLSNYTLLFARGKVRTITAHLALLVMLIIPALYFWSSSGGALGASQAVVFARVVSLPVILFAAWKELTRAPQRVATD